MVSLIPHGSEEVPDGATFIGSEFAQICLQGDSDVLPPVHLNHSSPASLQLPHDRAIQGLLFYSVTHILEELKLLFQAPEEWVF